MSGTFYLVTFICNTSSSSSLRKKGRAGSANGAGSSLQQFQAHMGTLSDFDSEDELQIDETPPPRRRPSLPSKKKLSGKRFLTFIDNACMISLFLHHLLIFVSSQTYKTYFVLRKSHKDNI